MPAPTLPPTLYLFRYEFNWLDGRGTVDDWDSVWAETPELAQAEAGRRTAAKHGFNLQMGRPTMQQTPDGVARDMDGWALPDRWGHPAQIMANVHEAPMKERFYRNPEVPRPAFLAREDRADLRRRLDREMAA